MNSAATSKKTDGSSAFCSRDEIGLYLHFPFCRRKCCYCDFNSYSGLEDLIPSYTRALATELKKYPDESRLVRSIYFGGGTPSLVPVALLTDLLKLIKDSFNIQPAAEITIEINPGTIVKDQLTRLKTAGFNRLSIGLQSTEDRHLEAIGRIHDYQQFLSTYNSARQAGFTNISVDLIFGLPGQTLPDWRKTIEKVVQLAPEHISAYGLQLEESTPLWRMVQDGVCSIPTDDDVAVMMETAMTFLPGSGYGQYEISNYARPGYASLHNLGYWLGLDYLGFGAGAYSTVREVRYFNNEDPSEYIRQIEADLATTAITERLTPLEKAVEFLMLGLRLSRGIDTREFGERFGIDLHQSAGTEIKTLTEQGLLQVEGVLLQLTRRGMLLSNSVIASLMAALSE